jgi:radical SAM protein with 4Fe4S-binding SPASM domain
LINFQQNENELLEVFLDSAVFNQKRNYSLPNYRPPRDENAFPVLSEGLGIELIVRPECNQQCEYCYVYQHGKKLYPIEERVSNEIILKNLRAFLDYTFNTRKIFINRWELFAGDLFYDDLYYDILDVFYDIIKPLYQIYHHLFANGRHIDILTPSNCSFIQSDEKLIRFEEYYEKMSSIGVNLVISYSTDGKYATDSREKYDVSDEFYDKAFAFLKKHHYGPHPMISAENIDNYIKNFDWWTEQIPKFSEEGHPPMFLEVRNNNWTTEKIDKYEELLHHIIKYEMEKFGSKEAFAEHLFRRDAMTRTGYDIIRLLPRRDVEDSARYSCSMQWLLSVTLNNLNIVPCHRTTYSQFRIGRFVQDENGNITGVEGKNVGLGLTIHGFKANTLPRCAGCKYVKACSYGCLGSQFETSGELFAPIDCVCDLSKRKIRVLSTEYRDLGLLDIALEKNYIEQSTYDQYMAWCNEDKEVPWITIARNNKPLSSSKN